MWKMLNTDDGKTYVCVENAETLADLQGLIDDATEGYVLARLWDGVKAGPEVKVDKASIIDKYEMPIPAGLTT